MSSSRCPRILGSFTVVAMVLMASLVFASGASAASVDVKLHVSMGNRAAAKATCLVSVSAGADGVSVLQAAVATGCISSYKLENFGFGDYVSCIDGICEQVGTYWAMYENRAYTSYGIRGFRSDHGDELWFNYEQYVTCLTPLGC